MLSDYNHVKFGTSNSNKKLPGQQQGARCYGSEIRGTLLSAASDLLPGLGHWLRAQPAESRVLAGESRPVTSLLCTSVSHL